MPKSIMDKETVAKDGKNDEGWNLIHNADDDSVSDAVLILKVDYIKGYSSFVVVVMSVQSLHCKNSFGINSNYLS